MNSEVGKSFDIHTSLVINEWAEDREFYERLIDGDQSTLDIFNFQRKIMDSE